MGGDLYFSSFAAAPLEVIDGDRGQNYPKQSDFMADGYCLFLNAGNVTSGGFNFSNCAFISKEKDNTLRKGKLERHDLVLTTRGTVGNVAYFDRTIPFNNVRINSGMVILRPFQSKLDSCYLYQYLRSRMFMEQVESLQTGSAQPQLPIRDINQISLPLPPLPTQKAIAHILGTLDDKIELNRQMNETLEAMSRALFKSWFVDFDPVRAKAAGRQPAGMDAATAKLFPDAFEMSELGEIPRGWRYGDLSEVAMLNPSTSAPRGHAIPYVEMASLPTVGHRATSWPLRPASSGARFINGDTVLARITPCLENGKTGLVDFLADGEVGWGSTEFIVIRPKPPLPPGWGYLLARDSTFRDFAVQKMEGSTGRQRVSAASLGRYKVAVPSSTVALAFGRLLSDWFGAMGKKHDENATLSALRDTLLPPLLSGELSIPDAERFVGRAV